MGERAPRSQIGRPFPFATGGTRAPPISEARNFLHPPFVGTRYIHQWIYVLVDIDAYIRPDLSNHGNTKTMIDKSLPEELIPLRPVVFEILLILNERRLHGYGIMKEVAGRSSGRTIMGPGTLYRTLKEMQQLGLVVHTSRRGSAQRDDNRRRYYRITKYGQRVAAAEAARMAALVGAAKAGNLISDPKRA